MLYSNPFLHPNWDTFKVLTALRFGIEEIFKSYRTLRFLSPEKSTLVIRVMLFLSRSLEEKDLKKKKIRYPVHHNDHNHSISLVHSLSCSKTLSMNSRPPDA